jgi:hypothetical protein
MSDVKGKAEPVKAKEDDFKEFYVKSSTKMSTVLELAEKGKILKFDFKDLPEFSEGELSALEEAHREISRAYLQARGIFQQWTLENDNKNKPRIPTVEIDDPLELPERNLLKFEEVEGMHNYAAHASEVADREAMGYVKVKTLVTNEKGQPVHVAMRISEEKYRKHMNAVGQRSKAQIDGANTKHVEYGNDKMMAVGGLHVPDDPELSHPENTEAAITKRK